eukprot:TRINITY_DN65304_c0_g1_i1.p1 TRINITY_DN65304_c0_g1~~TRINITY_DN65304_c0_g1_i1.p1  ORF type:complete len:740 (-),score=152.13 TRINITY_DN65304_c0_g1_i1:85-2304(-)
MANQLRLVVLGLSISAASSFRDNGQAIMGQLSVAGKSSHKREARPLGYEGSAVAVAGSNCKDKLAKDYKADSEDWKNATSAFDKIDQCASWCHEHQDCKSFAIYWKHAKVEDFNAAWCHLCKTEDVNYDYEWENYIWYGKPEKVEYSSETNGDQPGSTVLADFNASRIPGDKVKGLWFGVATAAPHVEDDFGDDPWIHFAKKGGVAAYNSSVAGPFPDKRLKFFSEPEIELDLAQGTGSEVFRMGVDWGRLSADGTGVTNHDALKRYREICQMVKHRGMKLMLTLFHHSMPVWAAKQGGWQSSETVVHFLNMAKDVVKGLGDLVDYWVPFNEAHVFVMLTDCQGAWPPGIDPRPDPGHVAACIALPNGKYAKALDNIVEAHKSFYNWAHGPEGLSILKKKPVIGMAHNVGRMVGQGVVGKLINLVSERLTKLTFGLPDALKSHLDYLGLNYYSKEMVTTSGPAILDSEEYSESGRAVHPEGLHWLLTQFHERYPQTDPSVKFTSYIITENGISDATDVLRPSYIIEHLLAVRQAQHEGVPVEGYVHWTISDNWEWADGYCPQFGLVSVDRSTDEFKRTKRASYDLYAGIVKSLQITKQQRDDAWAKVTTAVLKGESRPFCRDTTANDPSKGLDEPMQRPFVALDWRFQKLQGAEDKCLTTPWRSADDRAIPTTDGSCALLPDQSNKKDCPANIWMLRDIKCPGAVPVRQKVRKDCECIHVSPSNSSGGIFGWIRGKLPL